MLAVDGDKKKLINVKILTRTFKALVHVEISLLFLIHPLWRILITLSRVDYASADMHIAAEPFPERLNSYSLRIELIRNFF